MGERKDDPFDAAGTLLRSVFNLVGAEHKTPIIVGVLIFGAIGLYVRAIPIPEDQAAYWWLVALQNVPVIFWPVLGAGIALVPWAFRTPRVSERQRATLALIDELMNKAECSKSARRDIWNKVIVKYAENAGPEIGLEEIERMARIEIEKVGVGGAGTPMR